MFWLRSPLLVAVVVSASAQGPVSIRVLLGATDTESASWDGGVRVQGASIVSIEPWRFEGTDAIDGNRWRISTHPARRFGGANQAAPPPVVVNGVVITLSGPTTLDFDSPRGPFRLRTGELAYGRFTSRLDGRVLAERIPTTARITDTVQDEEDFPSAAAGPNGTVWMAYVAFRHHPRHNELRVALRAPLQDFAPPREFPGGDQVLLCKYSGGKWSEPIPITASGFDICCAAVAVDGRGRIWVFWSQNDRGNFDIFGRGVSEGTPGPVVQISKEVGADIDPVVAADSKGNVWVAWQGWSNGRARIYAATQNGAAFSAPAVVSRSAGNEWNPAIAAASDGRITVAYDSYRNGNYDIFMRTATRAGAWGPEAAIAAAPRYEGYASIAYDSTGRLWAAYEEGGSGWGKDFGAYDTGGIALYRGRLIRLVGIEPGGARVETQADLGAVLPGAPVARIDKPGSQSGSQALDPDSNIARNRQPNAAAQNIRAPRNSYPRLIADSSGRLWLAFRSAFLVWWTRIGTVLAEHLVSFDGASWTPSIYLHHSDNLLDNRPALASTAAGSVMILRSSDGRREFRQVAAMNVGPNAARGRPAIQGAPDPYNNNLYSTEISLGPAIRPAAVKPAAPQNATPPATGEAAMTKRLRDYRADTLRIARGEFHRHSEISTDSGQDGSLLDLWRYALDAAGLDWVGCCDHDNGNGREYTWWLEQKLTDVFYTPGVCSPMFSYERSVPYPKGHRNVIFARRGVRPLPRLPITSVDDSRQAPDTQMLYAYLKFFDGIVGAHTSGTNMGTDWRDNDTAVEPVVEIYQGDRQNYEMPEAPRSNSEHDSIGGWRPKGFVNLALEKGYKLGFEASSDHVSTHISYCNRYVKELTRDSILDALKKRHVYAATDNILVDVRSGGHMMGDSFSTASAPLLRVRLSCTAKFTKVSVIKDNVYVYSTNPDAADVQYSWIDSAPVAGKTSYCCVRGEQGGWADRLGIPYVDHIQARTIAHG